QSPDHSSTFPASRHFVDVADARACYHDAVARPGSRLPFDLVLVPAHLLVGALSYLAWRQSVPGVRAELSPAPKFIGIRTPLTLQLRAARGDVRSVEVRHVQDSARVTVAQQAFTGARAEERVELVLAGKDL